MLDLYLCSINPRYAIAIWIVTGVIGVFVSYYIKEDLRRMQLDDVKNSEYIEEEVLKHSTAEQRQQILFNSNVIAD